MIIEKKRFDKHVWQQEWNISGVVDGYTFLGGPST